MNALPWSIAAVALVTAGLLAAADTALVAAARSTTGEATRRAEREKRHRSCSMALVLAYLTTGAAVALAAQLAEYTVLIRAVAGLGVAVLVVAFVEGAARAIGFSFGAGTLRRLKWLIRCAEIVLSPAVLLGARLDALLQRLVPAASMDDEDRETSAERFREIVAAEADVSIAEEALIRGAFSLGDREVQEIMVPRVDIVGIDNGTPWSEVVDRVRSSEHARFPVYEETLDDVLGLLYAKDLLPAVIADEEPERGWTSLVRPAVFIPVSKPVDAQLRDFKTSHTHIAIVSDEYGGTAGLVTIEDVLEEIVGEIRDEYDEEEPEIEREGDSRFWIAGGVSIDEMSELLGTDFASEDVTTVGGVVYELFGRVPRAGESLVTGGYRIVVERVRRRRVERVYFERMEPAASREA